jgi:hypothetical protein
VDASFSGHDHISEHLSHGGVHYFVAGAGALTDKAGGGGSAADVLWVGAGTSHNEAPRFHFSALTCFCHA